MRTKSFQCRYLWFPLHKSFNTCIKDSSWTCCDVLARTRITVFIATQPDCDSAWLPLDGTTVDAKCLSVVLSGQQSTATVGMMRRIALTQLKYHNNTFFCNPVRWTMYNLAQSGQWQSITIAQQVKLQYPGPTFGIQKRTKEAESLSPKLLLKLLTKKIYNCVISRHGKKLKYLLINKKYFFKFCSPS